VYVQAWFYSVGLGFEKKETEFLACREGHVSVAGELLIGAEMVALDMD